MPRRVAVSLSMLSTPMAAEMTTRSLGARSMAAPVLTPPIAPSRLA
jgi:hypothetical protein